MNPIGQDMIYRDLLRQSRNITQTGRIFCNNLVEWIDSDLWRKHWDEDRQKYHECKTFKEFMEESPAKGLGLDFKKAMDELKILSAGGVRNATRVIAMWADGDKLESHGGKRETIEQVDNVNSPKGGNSTEYTLRRLARDCPEMLKKVQAGEVSVNAAAIKAGIRKKPSPAEVCVKAFRKAENRLEPLRLIVDSLELYEAAIVRDWVVEKLN